jgi:polyhydroxyalkanoate synthesis repressor PhaR
MPEKHHLKKYANRRLYDTAQSRYVTLEEVADIIKGGRQVEVADAKTGEDVTAFILTQIVLERARKKNILLPPSLLHLLIQYGDNLLAEFFEKYLEQTIKTYIAYRSAFDDQIGKMLDMPANFSEMAQKGMAGVPPFQSIFKGLFEDTDDEKKGG